MASLLRFVAAVLPLSALAVARPISKRDLFLQVPHDDPFYNAPSNLESLKNGEIYNTRTVYPEIQYAGAAHVSQIAFRTTDTFGNASHTVATVFEPHNPDPSAKLLSQQVAEDADNIDCSPSYSLYGGLLVPDGATVLADSSIMVQWAMSRGYYAVITDFEGPDSTFFAGFNEGYGGIDGIRAALSHLNLSTDTPVAMYGYSGGAHATVWMTNLVGDYAPELNIVGAAHGGTPADPRSTMQFLDGGQQAGFVLGALGGLLKAYPEHKKEIWPKLNEKLQKDLEMIWSDNTCIITEVALFVHTEFHTQTSLPDFYTYPPIVDLLQRESLLANVSSHNVSTPKFPRYIFHSLHDDVIPYPQAKQYVDQQCSNGANIQFVEWPGGNHVTLEVAGIPNAIQFLQQAFDNKTPNLTCGTAADDILTIGSVTVGSIIGQAIADAIKALDNIVTPLGKIILNL